MKIAISNIAWDLSEDDAIAEILKKHLIKGIEIAPTKIWQDPTHVLKDDVYKYRKYWNDQGIELVAMQSLLYGHPELTLFDSPEQRKMMHDYLSRIMELAAHLGIQALVFGSPKNRIKGEIDTKSADEMASSFFDSLGDVAKQHNVKVCLEANPTAYGTDFLTTTAEVIAFVKKVNHPYINVHLDTGAMKMNNEDYLDTIRSAQPFSHFHISEPNLLSVPKEVDHQSVAEALKQTPYEGWVSIEMRNEATPKNSKRIDETLTYVTSVYK